MLWSSHFKVLSFSSTHYTPNSLYSKQIKSIMSLFYFDVHFVLVFFFGWEPCFCKKNITFVRKLSQNERNKSIGGARVTVLLFRWGWLSLVKNWMKKVVFLACDMELWVVSTTALSDSVPLSIIGRVQNARIWNWFAVFSEVKWH